MDFALSEEQEELAGPRGAHPRGPHGPAAPEGARPLRRLVRPRHVAGVREGEPARHRVAGVGRRSRPRLPRPVHGVARGRPQRRAAARRSRRSSRGALPIARFGTDAQQAILAEGRRAATCCSPPRSSSTAPSPSARRRPRRATATAGASTASKANVPGATAAELDARARARSTTSVAMFLVPDERDGHHAPRASR